MHIPESLLGPAIRDVLCIEEVYWADMPPGKNTVNPNSYTFYHNYGDIFGRLPAGVKTKYEYLEGDIRYIKFNCIKNDL